MPNRHQDFHHDFYQRLYHSAAKFCQREALSDLEKLRVLYDEAAKHQSRSRVSDNTLASYITENILPQGVKMHNAQIARTRQKRVFPRRLRPYITQYFSEHFSHFKRPAPQESDIAALEKFFVQDPLNKPWFSYIERILREQISPFGTMIICNRQGSILLGEHPAYRNIPWNWKQYLHSKVNKVFEDFNLEKTCEEGDLAGLVERFGREGSPKSFYTIILPWETGFKYFKEAEVLNKTEGLNKAEGLNDKGLGWMLGKMRLAVCYDGLDNIALETAGRKPKELPGLAAKAYDGYIAPFLDNILLNWCRLHRQNNAFAQVIGND